MPPFEITHLKSATLNMTILNIHTKFAFLYLFATEPHFFMLSGTAPSIYNNFIIRGITNQVELNCGCLI